MSRPNLEGTAGELPTIALKMPQAMLEKINDLARAELTTRSALIRRALLIAFPVIQANDRA